MNLLQYHIILSRLLKQADQGAMLAESLGRLFSPTYLSSSAVWCYEKAHAMLLKQKLHVPVDIVYIQCA